jgi:hypothetical protein
LHRAEYDSSSTKLLDHTISTTSNLVITGTGASRQITSGTIVLQHNLARYYSTSTVATTLTHSAGCCWPTGGTMTTTYTGKAGSTTETVTFGPTCGKATVGNATVTFTHCF